MKRPKAYGRDGRLVPLGPELGRGGEGSVFEVADPRGLVAKIYHKPVGGERAAKIEAMVPARTESLLKIAAWPVEALYDQPGGRVTGLLMPRISGFKEIHTLYGPKSRLLEFPNATWAFLLHAAKNLARALAVIHEQGHVVGDINHGNILVSAQGLIKLIDCDSFQIRNGSRVFRCEVGVPTHTPPELQGRPLREVVRSPNHDAFGLAVVIFQLLFMARHPFSGRYLGSGDMPLEKAIHEFRFAYGQTAAQRQMQQPPHTLSLTMIPPHLAHLFERAFSPDGTRDGARPKPNEWVTALEATQLRTCSGNPAHSYSSTLSACPWCAIEGQAGTLLFNLVAAVRTATGSFDLAGLWAQITAVPSPAPAPPPVPNRNSFHLQPSPAAAQHGRKHRLYLLGGWGLGIAGSVLSLFAGDAAMLLIGISILLAWLLIRTRPQKPASDARQAVQIAQARLSSLANVWNREAGTDLFQTALRELEGKRASLLDLPALRQRRLAALQANIRNAQLRKFLDRHQIEDAKIKGIGPGRQATLESYGIETAADIIGVDILRVPGFGPALTDRLLTWRQEVERRFVFDPSKGIDPADLAAMERDLATRRSQLEQDLLKGPAHLRQIAQQTAVKRQALGPQIHEAARAFAQAEVDLKAF